MTEPKIVAYHPRRIRYRLRRAQVMGGLDSWLAELIYADACSPHRRELRRYTYAARARTH